MKEESSTRAGGRAARRAFAAALPHTLPILAAFWFLGMTYGMYMQQAGFSFWVPMATSFTVFGGSLEFVLVSLLRSPFNPAQTLALTLVIQARHLFYGVSMLDRYRGTGWKKPYLIFGLCDESFSINYAARVPPDIDRGWFMLWVTALNHFYWVSGATMGGLLGTFLTFSTEGISFAMTALFLVIFIEQWRSEKRHASALIGLGASAGCLLLLGADRFLLPAMGVTLAALLAGRAWVEGDAPRGKPEARA